MDGNLKTQRRQNCAGVEAVEPRVHGGDLAEARRLSKTLAGPLIDLSTGINPRPYPLPPIPDDAWTALPQRDALKGLLAAARRAYAVDPEAEVLAGPGTQSLIQALPRVCAGYGTAAIVSPTYNEHAHVWDAAEFPVEEIADPREAVPGHHGVLVLVNPNNPDGRRWEPRDLLPLVRAMAAGGGVTIVDEAFADGAPEISLASQAGQAGLIVLRSFGKMFGLAGLRLGFALGDATRLAALVREIGPWAVSGPAIEVGAAALNDSQWLADTRRDLAARRAALDAVLAGSRLAIIGGTDLFRLVALPGAAALQRHLAHDGIWTRAFDYEPRWLRLGLHPDESALARLEASLAAWARRAAE